MEDMETNIIRTIKCLGMDMIAAAGSGHPGIVLGAAPILYTLFAKHICVNTNDDKWINRDRFVMSAGHGSALLYATLFMAGYDLTADDLRNFRQLNSRTPGHPELNVTPGVDVSTGPLGQGFANAVGMAIGEVYLRERYQLPKKGLFSKQMNAIDFHTYVLCGDGDLMEGIAYEAASLAGTLRLGHLIVLYDSNSISLDGSTDHAFTENVRSRFEAMGWHTDLVRDANDVGAIDKAIARAKAIYECPSLIEIKSVIGEGLIGEGTNAVHGTPVAADVVKQFKEKWGLPTDPFQIVEAYRTEFRRMLTERSRQKFNDWNEAYRETFKEKPFIAKEAASLLSGQVDLDNFHVPSEIEYDKFESMRVSNQRVMNQFAEEVFNLIGGSADLFSSTKTYLKQMGDFSFSDRTGRNIYFGVREHAMGAILNGLATIGFRPFGSTFLAFSDYMKPAIRMSALMDLPVTYIFTHDSVTIGQDGPTHQPIEQLESLRMIPNLDVYRPADIKEIYGCWKAMLKRHHPSALIISRNDVTPYTKTDAEKVELGGYIVKDCEDYLNGIIIATGTELRVAIDVANRLEKKGYHIRVVSMPSRELFLQQTTDYHEFVFPKYSKVIVLETGASGGWFRFVYNKDYLITLDQFGKSGRGADVLKEFHLDIDAVEQRIEALLK